MYIHQCIKLDCFNPLKSKGEHSLTENISIPTTKPRIDGIINNKIRKQLHEAKDADIKAPIYVSIAKLFQKITLLFIINF